ncbi:hypothetical protein [Roseibacillus ishigakijimensis]|uniref:Uncharacterized protein n=1 Tax=Roseibacillus ishigakijimensis TaxID=454146 RepID=A0A934RQ65_9BACT|nr:hypothetical protein [Roseibacillus ishigakijimensis]MBK1833832.1 hypothetical protein [Roseibacillus ishigakijimensis]
MIGNPNPMLETYSIKSRSHRCHVTGEAFVEDQPFIAAIFPDPEGPGYLRMDYSLPAWEQRGAEDPVPFSFWRSHYRPPEKESKAEVTPHDPETLFVKLVEEDEEHTENARFILAAMLERKKIIRETDTQELESGLMRLYEHRKTGDVYLIRDPQIALADVASIQEEVQALLDPKEPPAPPAEEEGEEAEGERPPAETADGEAPPAPEEAAGEDEPPSPEEEDGPPSA